MSQNLQLHSAMDGLERSRWARQTPNRAKRLSVALGSIK